VVTEDQALNPARNLSDLYLLLFGVLKAKLSDISPQAPIRDAFAYGKGT